MQYKKVITLSLIFAVVFAIVNEFVFAASTAVTGDGILDGALKVLVMIQKYSWPVVTLMIQKYSWPVVTLLMVWALYKYYVMGNEVLAEKVVGQRMVVGIAIFMVVVQCLPLVYAFFIV